MGILNNLLKSIGLDKNTNNNYVSALQVLRSAKEDLIKAYTYNKSEDEGDRIIHFFNGTSKLSDAEELFKVIFAEDGKKDDTAKIFLKAIKNAGRNLYGINRSSKGTRVTEENVFLGGVHGYRTQSIVTWKKIDPGIFSEKSQNPEIKKQALNFRKEYEKIFNPLRESAFKKILDYLDSEKKMN